MTCLQDYRTQYPQTDFQTRPLKCADGITRMVLLTTWYWDKLDLLLEVGTHSLRYITDLCFDTAHDSAKEEGWDLDHAFHELLMYYIYRNYTEYSNHRRGIANDNFEDCIR